MITSRESIESALIQNPRFANGCPGIAGMSYQECLKVWEGTKVKLANKIRFDLDRCELANGNEFARLVWACVYPQLIRANWVARCGVFPVWKVIYKKASMKVQQDLAKEKESQPKPIFDAMQEALKSSGAMRTFDEASN